MGWRDGAFAGGENEGAAATHGGGIIFARLDSGNGFGMYYSQPDWIDDYRGEVAVSETKSDMVGDVFRMAFHGEKVSGTYSRRVRRGVHHRG
jgi:hypothetical protein